MAGSSKKVIYAAMIGNSLISITKEVAAQVIETSVTELTKEIKVAYPVVKHVFIEAESRSQHTDI